MRTRCGDFMLDQSWPDGWTRRRLPEHHPQRQEAEADWITSRKKEGISTRVILESDVRQLPPPGALSYRNAA